MRDLEPDNIARLRKAGDFFCTDLGWRTGRRREEVGAAFGLSSTRSGPCSTSSPGLARPPAARRGGPGRVRVLVLGDPGAAPLGGAEISASSASTSACTGISCAPSTTALRRAVGGGSRRDPVRSERFAVFVSLEGMTATLLEALNSVERESRRSRPASDEDEQARKPRHPPHHPQPALTPYDPPNAHRCGARRLRAGQRGDRSRAEVAGRQGGVLRPHLGRLTGRSIGSTRPQARSRTSSTSSSTRPPSGSR